ncbi:MFS transporter [Geomonas sp. Red32]|uniref:MFS transporter n=1 Tax=Geomonas sp. Red32 TaxID=2912856 RepID=UPI00202CB0A3|nr:MFS transporter [Geomonas sp. Red32]MCM0082551.1 MFS transporter [Geomonas sp. Red32]
MTALFKGLSGNVLIFGFVSLFTDVSSEMIYPLLPLFLSSVLGAGPAFLGAIEGVAESTASLLKLASGIMSDRVRARKGLVLFGYSISSLMRPLIGAAQSPLAVLIIRAGDRVGKGVRTSPRDALIADSVDPSLRGKAYGFHRSMDNAGALIGPLIATLLLAVWLHDDLRTLFWLAGIPGLIAVALIVFKVQDSGREVPPKQQVRLSSLPAGPLRRYLFILFLFTLGNSSDAFLLLKAGQLGVPVFRIPLLWAFFSAVKMLASMPFGVLSDRIGRRKVIVAGWLVYALCYLGFAFASRESHIWILFACYGLFYGLTEGVEKALVADLSDPFLRGAAFGWYNFAIGAGALPASLIFGLIWQRFGSHASFLVGTGLAGVSVVLLLLLVKPPAHAQ